MSLPNTSTLHEKHYPALDGLRGIAALMVVAYHSASSYWLTNTFDKAYLRATSFLWVGVDLFFILSGFLITNILLDTKQSSTYFRTFYLRRFLRIFPLYYAFLVAIYIVVPALGVKLPRNLADVQIWQWTYTSNIYVGFHGWPNENINHLWTLAIEEQFYLLWPLVLFFLQRNYLKISVIALFLFLPFLRASCLALGLSTNFIYTFTFCHMDGLLLGAILSLLVHEGLLETFKTMVISRFIRHFDWAITFIVAALGLLYCLVLRNDQFKFNILTWPWYGQCIGVSLISLPLAYTVLRSISSDQNFLKRALSIPLLRSVGKYSYALYLLHMPVCYFVGAYFPVPHFLLSLPKEWSFLHSIYLIVMQFSLSIVAAILSWHILEKHFLKLKRYFPYRTSSDTEDRLEFGPTT